MKSEHFYSHGKLLITGEYLVLDGAQALAIPCKFGQSLKVSSSPNPFSRWTSYDHQQRVWLDVQFNMLDVIAEKQKAKNDLEGRLFQILKEAYLLNPQRFKQNFQFETHLEFPQNWGLGTSSTLISNLALWADVNPYKLLDKTFGGSGYDIACATADTALVYSLKNNKPEIKQALFPDLLKPYVYFVHLGQKQNSRDAIRNYRRLKSENLREAMSRINAITEAFQHATSLETAQQLISEHEQQLSSLLQTPPVQSRLFPDFEGGIKSLGAWGGDFIMALSKHNSLDYFKHKGYKTIIKFEDMIL